jgi:hypothetical protein
MFSKCLGHTGDKQKVCLAAATIAEAKRLHKVTFLSPSLKGLRHEINIKIIQAPSVCELMVFKFFGLLCCEETKI